MSAADDELCCCYDCGAPAPWIILMAGEDETPYEERACEVHARGHWRWALVTPVSTELPAGANADGHASAAAHAW